MTPGDLDNYISLERLAETPDELGDLIETWVPLAPAWSEKKYLKGRELLEAQQLVAEVEVKFTIWYSEVLKDLDEKDRIVDHGQIFDILSVFPIPGGRPVRFDILARLRSA